MCLSDLVKVHILCDTLHVNIKTLGDSVTCYNNSSDKFSLTSHTAAAT